MRTICTGCGVALMMTVLGSIANPVHVTGQSTSECPVTRPTVPPFVVPAGYAALQPGAGDFFHGTAAFWTRLPARR